MRPRLALAAIFSLALVLGMSSKAFADGTSTTVATTPSTSTSTTVDPTAGKHQCDPADSGGYWLPIGEPCPVHTPPTLQNPNVKYCLGYTRTFTPDEPCPKPPQNLCDGASAKPFECTDPGHPAPIPDVQPPTTSTTAPEAPTPSISATTVLPAPAPVYGPHRAVSKHVVRHHTTSTTAPAPYLPEIIDYLFPMSDLEVAA